MKFVIRVLGNGILVLKTKFWCKVCACQILIIVLDNKAK